jgi:hypothetical protein
MIYFVSQSLALFIHSLYSFCIFNTFPPFSHIPFPFLSSSFIFPILPLINPFHTFISFPSFSRISFQSLLQLSKYLDMIQTHVINNTKNVYSLEYNDIPKVFFTSHHVGYCCTVIPGDWCTTIGTLWSHCCTTVGSNNGNPWNPQKK